MHLLNTKSLELQEFPNHEDVSYAILSHTWAEDEVLFQEIQGSNVDTIPPPIKQKAGYKKIEACCAQAARDGFRYAWIDTCCIDKRSSAELSEAINSMYRWYQNCAVCYAYLADVPDDVEYAIQLEKFRESRWFTRGWTLQELIAPPNLEFYGTQWHSKGQKASLGTKRSLQHEVSNITGIPNAALNVYGEEYGSIAQRMSWAAGRKTARIEDRAYCLMGLFDVNMPLLYGEGSRAFIRLQEEIMKRSTDESLFAWGDGSLIKEDRLYFQGLLATSPDHFANSGSIIQKIHSQRATPFSATSRGLRLEVIILNASDILESSTIKSTALEIGQVHVAVLNCIDESSQWLVGIPLSSFRYPQYDGQDHLRVCTEGLVYIDPATSILSETNPREIFAAQTAGNFQEYGPFFRENFEPAVLLTTTVNHFRLFEAHPKNSWELVGNKKYI